MHDSAASGSNDSLSWNCAASPKSDNGRIRAVSATLQTPLAAQSRHRGKTQRSSAPSPMQQFCSANSNNHILSKQNSKPVLNYIGDYADRAKKRSSLRLGPRTALGTTPLMQSGSYQSVFQTSVGEYCRDTLAFQISPPLDGNWWL